MMKSAIVFSLAACIAIEQAVSAVAAPARSHSSSASCSASAFATSTSVSEDAFVELGVDIAKYICSKDKTIQIDEKVETVARAIAEATAITAVSCDLSGNASGTADATATSRSNATASAEALGRGIVSVKTCDGCEAEAEVFVEAAADAFVSAIAESKSKIEVYTDARGREKSVARKEVIRDVQEAILPTFVSIVGTLESKVNDGKATCKIVLDACATAGTEFGCCDITVGSVATTINEDAVAETRADADAAITCLGTEDAEAHASTTAKAAARAYAKALSEGHAWCESTSGGSACAWAQTSITAMAHAQALAFAEAWALAENDCGCSIEVESFASALETIYVQATSEILLDVCVEGEGFAGTEALVVALEDKTIEAVAHALADAAASGTGCSASTKACARSGESKACCELAVDSQASSEDGSAYANVAVEASVYLCEPGEASAQAEVTASAIATAWAKVITRLDGECASSGYASACSLSTSTIEAVAKLEAHALASAWAATESDCGCSVEVDTVAEVVEAALIKATLDVFAEMCVSGEAYAGLDVFVEVINKGSIEAIASALASVKQTIAKGGHCDAEAEASSDATIVTDTVVLECHGDCAPRNRKCAGRADDTESYKACCDPKQHCVRVNSKRAKCRDKARNIPRRWDGSLVECSA